MPSVIYCRFSLIVAMVSPALCAPEAAISTAPAAPESILLSADVYPDGVGDEQAYERYVQQQLSALLGGADDTDDVRLQIERRLAAANWILARQAEPHVSRLLLNIKASDDRASLQRCVAAAREQLDRCGALIDDVEAGTASKGPDADISPDRANSDEQWNRFREATGLLSGFADGFAAAWAVESNEESMEQARMAATTLGLALEDPRPGVAETAGLYQAAVYARIEQPDRALAVLDLALRPPPAGNQRAALYARLLRCRLLAQQGQFVTAWSLLLRLEERIVAWFISDDVRENATHAAIFTRIEVARRWKQSLSRGQNEAETHWCEEQTEQLEAALADRDQPVTILRLGDAVPILVEVELPDRATTSGQTESARP